MVLFIFIAVTIIGFTKHGFKYSTIFPHVVPVVLLPLITLLKISYLSDQKSFSEIICKYDRHTMLKVFGSFNKLSISGWLPLSFSVALIGLEILAF